MSVRVCVCVCACVSSNKSSSSVSLSCKAYLVDVCAIESDTCVVLSSVVALLDNLKQQPQKGETDRHKMDGWWRQCISLCGATRDKLKHASTRT